MKEPDWRGDAGSAFAKLKASERTGLLTTMKGWPAMPVVNALVQFVGRICSQVMRPRHALRNVGMAIVVSLLALSNIAPASADSISGAVERWPEEPSCTTWGWDPPGYTPGPCFLQPVEIASRQTGDTANALRASSTAVVDNALTTDPTHPETFVQHVLGELSAQVENLTGLRTVVKAEPGLSESHFSIQAESRTPVPVTLWEPVGIRVRPECLGNLSCTPWVTVTRERELARDWSDDAWNFDSIATAHRRWYPEDTGNQVDGIAIYNLYRAAARPSPQWDYFATSQMASVSPLNGWRLTDLHTYIKPKQESIQVVNFEPRSVSEYGSSGSRTITATLSGEPRMQSYNGGASFAISRTWNRNAGAAGGGMTSSEVHWADWYAADTGSTPYTREVSGLATWKQAAEHYSSWSTLGIVRTRD